MRAFVQRFAGEQKLARPLGVSAGAMALLTAYDWPGNIRQLENAIFRAVVLSEGAELTAADFPQIAAQVPGHGLAEGGAATWEASGLPAQEPAAETRLPSVYPDFRPGESVEAAAADNAISSVDRGGHVRKLADVEEELIRFALKFYHGQMSQVARKLGIGRSTLYRKLKDYGIDPDNPMKEAA